MLKSKIGKVVATAILAMGLASASSAHDGDDSPDAVFTMNNAVAGNRILSFARNEYGALRAGPSYATGGTGSGGGLGNQGGIVSDGEFLIAVNAGSSDISVFRMGRRGLRLVDRMPSGGLQPVSVTMSHNLVYVLNAASDNIAGFRMSPSGKLHVLNGSLYGLSGDGTGPAQIQFSHDRRNLIVTEKATNKILSFPLNYLGLPSAPKVITSAAPTPFGFAVTRNNRVIVSEAAGGAANASALSSYKVLPTGQLVTVDPAVATTQTAACWVVVTPDGRYAYTTNTGSGTVSSYRLRRNGDLNLLSAVGGSTGAGSGPIDMALTEDGEYLYVLNSGTDTIASFRVGADGSLQSLGAAATLPDGTNGLVAF
jgi:6-phosphogluconolactonase